MWVSKIVPVKIQRKNGKLDLKVLDLEELNQDYLIEVLPIGGLINNTKLWHKDIPTETAIKDHLTQIYENAEKDPNIRVGGPYGDIAIYHVTEYQDKYYCYSLISIGIIGFKKPNLAADCFITLEKTKGEKFFVGIKRNQKPLGLAPVGGFREVTGTHLSSPAETLFGTYYLVSACLAKSGVRDNHGNPCRQGELMEEVGIPTIFDKGLGTEPNIIVECLIANYPLSGRATKLGVFSCENNFEFLPKLNEIRVHETTGFHLTIQIPNDLTLEVIRKSLRSYDANEKNDVVVIPYKNPSDIVFPITHHQEMWKNV